MATEDYKDKSGKWRRSKRLGGMNLVTTSGAKWMAMKGRCTSGGSEQFYSPTYIGCTMSDKFKNFQLFTEWHRQQIGYGITDYELDKDVLLTGNKEYSENICILIPKDLNSFLNPRRRERGTLSPGVSWVADRGKFQAQISINGKNQGLGKFLNQDDAAKAYRTAKEAEAYRWYERLKAGEFIVDERVIERMRTWKLEDEA